MPLTWIPKQFSMCLPCQRAGDGGCRWFPAETCRAMPEENNNM